MSAASTVLDEGILRLGLEMDGAARDRLEAYIAEIETWNPTLGLVGATGEALVVRHILDSLAGAGFFRAELGPGARVLDVGSGAGLPGIPLAVALPALQMVLLDRSERRTTFLEHCVSRLALTNTRVCRGDVRVYRESVDAVTLRAVSPLEPRFLKKTALAERSDLLVAYKGTYAAALSEGEAVRDYYAEMRILKLVVPFLDAERHLLVLRRSRWAGPPAAGTA